MTGGWKLRFTRSALPVCSLHIEGHSAHQQSATHRANVTRLCFDRQPKAKEPTTHQREVAAMIRRACTSVDLPEAREVTTPVSPHLGAPPAHSCNAKTAANATTSTRCSSSTNRSASRCWWGRGGIGQDDRRKQHDQYLGDARQHDELR